MNKNAQISVFFFSVGLELATSSYEATTQSIPYSEKVLVFRNIRNFRFQHYILFPGPHREKAGPGKNKQEKKQEKTMNSVVFSPVQKILGLM